MTLNDYALAKREVLNSVSVPRRESFHQSHLGVKPEGTQRKTCVSVRLMAFNSLLIKRPVFFSCQKTEQGICLSKVIQIFHRLSTSRIFKGTNSAGNFCLTGNYCKFPKKRAFHFYSFFSLKYDRAYSRTVDFFFCNQ